MHNPFTLISLLGLFGGQTWGQTLTLKKGSAFPASSPSLTRTPFYRTLVGTQSLTIDSTYTNAKPLVILSPGYNEDINGIPKGLFPQTGDT